MRRHGFREQNHLRNLCALKDSAPLKLPTRYCLPRFLPSGLEYTTAKNAISLATPCWPKPHFKVSRLCYASQSYIQYQAVVKLLGSFRLTAGTRHLHRDCIFTELSSETVLQTLHYSTRQNFVFNSPIFKGAQTISSSEVIFAITYSFGCFRFPEPFI